MGGGPPGGLYRHPPPPGNENPASPDTTNAPAICRRGQEPAATKSQPPSSTLAEAPRTLLLRAPRPPEVLTLHKDGVQRNWSLSRPLWRRHVSHLWKKQNAPCWRFLSTRLNLQMFKAVREGGGGLLMDLPAEGVVGGGRVVGGCGSVRGKGKEYTGG